MHFDPRLRLALSLLAVLAVFAISTIGYHFITGASWGDSAYMTVITVSTVGYTEVFPLNHIGKLWTSFTIVLGVGTVSVAFSALLSAVVGGELREIREKIKMQSRISHLENHVIICGGGRIGALAADHLKREGIPFVLIEKNPAALRQSKLQDVLLVEGDATLEDTLLSARLKHAKALVASLPSDSDNLYISLTARELAPDLLIIARADHPSAEVKLKRAGANRVILPHVVGAAKIANILTRPNVVDFFDLASEGVELEINEYVIDQYSSMRNKSLKDSGLRQVAGVIVVAIKKHDGRMIFSPAAEETIQVQDTLIIVGPAGASRRLDEFEL